MPLLKPWYQSKTVWGALIAIGASLLKLAGFDLPEAAQDEIADAAVTLAGTFGGLLALYGRLTASSAIAKTGGGA